MLWWTSCWKRSLTECVSVPPAPAIIQARMHSLIPWEFPTLSHKETPGKNAPWGNVRSEMQRLKISKCLLQQLCLNVLPILVYFSNSSSLSSFSIAAITNNHKFSRLTQHLLAQSLWLRRPGRAGSAGDPLQVSQAEIITAARLCSFLESRRMSLLRVGCWQK